ncbi:MAG: DNA primase [Rhizobiales bacterium]|nr:DNA primase [Hyphomicrobiales bacterium]
MNQRMKLPPAVQRQLDAAAAQRGQSPVPPSLHRRPVETGAKRPPDPPETPLGERVEECAGLDHSDTDNGKRLRIHFGRDLLVVSQSKSKAPFYTAWTGTHWDTDNGGPRSLGIAQEVGDLIHLETDLILPSEDEAAAMDEAKAQFGKDWPLLDGDDLTKSQKSTLKQAGEARKAWMKRIEHRHAHALQTKNLARMSAMLACSAVYIMRDPDEFNADPMVFATPGYTIRFRKEIEEADGRAFARAAVDVEDGHRRSDMITQCLPVDYDPAADCPTWRAFTERMLPDEAVRRMVQIAFGLGLVGIPLQKLFFHYGSGANGKSVAMETICRVLGDLSVTLPATSFIGESNRGGAASPDIARLYGRRFLRVKELPQGEDLKEELVKEVTGGEALTARDLHQGYFDFLPLFVAHMSGNGFPRITGLDNGIWRRMTVVHWPVQLKTEEIRDFEDVLAGFEPEYSGILNWLIEGVCIYLEEGLIIPEAVARATQEYRDEMDPTANFCAACVAASPGGKLAAKDFYHAYVSWTIDQGGKPISLTRFGLIMKKKYERDDGRTNFYRDIALDNVPRSAADPGPPPEHWGDIPDI